MRKIRKSDVSVRMEQKEYSEADTVNDKRQKGIVFSHFIIMKMAAIEAMKE